MHNVQMEESQSIYFERSTAMKERRCTTKQKGGGIFCDSGIQQDQAEELIIN